MTDHIDARQLLAPEKFDIKEYISEYEFCGDGGDYTPNDFERALIEDAVHGCAHYMGEEHQAAIAALNQRIAELEAELAAALDVDWVSRPTYEAAMQRIAELEAERQWQPTHRHKKRGTLYQVISTAKMQAEDWYRQIDGIGMAPVDMRHVVVYRGEDGQTWARPVYEFEDGRFEALPASPHEGTQS